jgi:hypothetical protein
LLDLYKQFGSWYLAAASYNCGEGRVQRELNQSNHKNFWELSANQCLPNETKNYVPQMIAATIIAKNPKKFGFKNVPYLPPLKYDQVRVDETTSLTAAAVAVNVPPEEMQALNPELLRGVTPPDMPSYTLYLPSNSKELFVKNITIARIEHPAVASHPIRTARSSGHSYSHGRSSSHHHATVARKSSSPKRTYARSSGKSAKRHYARSAGKSAKRIYAKKERASHGAPAKSGVVQASLFGTPSLASKPSHTKKTKVALIGRSKNTSHGVKGKKSSETRLARKSDNSSRSSSRTRKSASHAKDKYSQGKSRRSIIISEAR